MADGLLIEIVALAVHDIDGGHDHARRAVAALQPMVLAEGLLHRMQRPARLGEALNGQNLGAVELPGEDGARLHGLAVDVHHAGATLRGVAAYVSTGEPQILPQELYQKRARVDVTGDRLTVHRHRNGRHERSSSDFEPNVRNSADFGRGSMKWGRFRPFWDD